MDAATSQDQQALATQLAEARAKLDGLVRDYRAIDAELDGLAAERSRHRLLQDVCVSLEQLREIGGADLFWGGELAASAGSWRWSWPHTQGTPAKSSRRS